MARIKHVRHLCCAMPVPCRASGVWQTRFNGWSLTTTILGVSSPVFFAVDEDEFLPNGPDGADQFVNSWQVMSESMGKARFGKGGCPEGIYVWIVDT